MLLCCLHRKRRAAIGTVAFERERERERGKELSEYILL